MTFGGQLAGRNRIGEGDLVGHGLRGRDAPERELMDDEAHGRLALFGSYLKQRLVGSDLVDYRAAGTGRPGEELRPVSGGSRSGNLNVQTFDPQGMQVVRPKYEIEIRTDSGQLVHGGQGWNIRGAVQTNGYVVSDKSWMRKIKPFITADLDGAGKGLRKCRNHLAASIGPAPPQVDAEQDTEHDEDTDRRYDPLTNGASLHGLHGFPGKRGWPISKM
jgi:hypothetical protein